MTRNQFCWIVLVLALLAPALGQDAAWAQSEPSAKEQEEAEVRDALQSIVKADPNQAGAAQAQKALDALDKPASSPEGRQARNRRERGSRRIVNGLPSRSHPAVGALLKGAAPESAGIQCTGTLVGCDKFLTAAHCISDDPTPGSYMVFFQELGVFPVKAIRWEKDKYKGPSPYLDLAMLTLTRPVEGIAPMPINTNGKPLNNSIATIVGFGRTGGTRFDYGIKREGTVKFAACPTSLAKVNALCWHFDADVIAGASAQNTCNADSGGGVFIRDNDANDRVVEKLFGTVSGGNRDCVTNDTAYNVDVFEYRDWIAAAGEGALSSSMCGRPLWGAQNAPVPKTVRFAEDKPETTLDVQVPEGARALRVAVNAEDDSRLNNPFTFSVSSGKDPAASEAACANPSALQFAFCEIKEPKAGPWTVAIKRRKGGGQVQITTLVVR